MYLLFRFLLSISLVLTSILSITPAHSQIIVPSKPALSSEAASIIDIIKAKQKLYVRESWGERASECFTNDDLERFHNSQTVKKIVDNLRKDKTFLSAIQALKALSPKQRDELLEKAASTYKPTWAQLGKIDRSGQTDAGQQAEKEIAAAVSGLCRELL